MDSNLPNTMELLQIVKQETLIKLPSFASLNPLLGAAREGNSQKLQLLLEEKSDECATLTAQIYPEDFKYHFKDLLQVNEEGRTALHLAAAVPCEEMSLKTIQVLLSSKQVLISETLELEEDDNNTIMNGREKLKKIVNYRDNNGEIGIIRAIENKSPKVVDCLIENLSDLLEKDKHGTEVLKLIYQKVPDALEKNYDSSIELNDDHKSLSINWGIVIGFRKSSETHWKDTEFLSSALTPSNKESHIFIHPLLKLFLYFKWKKIRWFFYASFAFHLFWLGLYTSAFILLHSSLSSNNSVAENGSENRSTEFIDAESFGGHSLWGSLITITILVGLKELYQLCILGRAYFCLRNVSLISFTITYVVQYFFLMTGDVTTGSSISVISLLLMTVLIIHLFGNIPYFGIQVYAIKKVVYTCAPHFPLLMIWFIGFGLIFWALLYQSEGSSAFGIPARIAAMGTGELDAKEVLETVLKGPGTFRRLIFVFCFLFFIFFVVLLHFNLLIGYAVADIQAINEEAEGLELHNRLSTIFTIESFVYSTALFLHFHTILDCLYVLPPAAFQKQGGIEDLPYDKIPTKILKEIKHVSFSNLEKNEK